MPTCSRTGGVSSPGVFLLTSTLPGQRETCVARSDPSRGARRETSHRCMAGRIDNWLLAMRKRGQEQQGGLL